MGEREREGALDAMATRKSTRARGSSSSSSSASLAVKKTAKKTTAKKKTTKAASKSPAAGASGGGGKQVELERLIKEEIPGISIEVNPSKPRKGTFEVRCGGKAIASFVAMPRPFTALRNADLETIATDVAAAYGK